MPSPAYALHPRLEEDTLPLIRWPLCEARLMNNALYPWVILIPTLPGLKEITDLEPLDRGILMEEIVLACHAMQHVYTPDKMNIAALGNQVPQLHIHIIARFATDAAWPEPVWGQGRKAYDSIQARETVEVLQRELQKSIASPEGTRRSPLMDE